MPDETESHSDTPADASRRALLTSGAALAAGSALAQMLPSTAHAQAADAELVRVQGQRRVLLKGGVVLSLDPRVGDFAQADVLIENGKISEVRPAIAVSAETTAVVDATNRIVLPGFIDTHHHFYQGILRNILSNGLLNPDYNRDISNILTAVYQPSDVYAGVLVTALGMIDAGTTTAVDTSQVSHSPEHSDAGIRALKESGLRAVYAYSRGAGPLTRYPEDIVRLQQTSFSTEDQLLTLALGGTLDAKIFAVAREAGVRTVSHGVNANTERTLVELGRMGLLRPGDEYIHCNHLSGIAWRLIKDTGGHVSLSPPIEMAMGHGMPAIQDALDHGIRPSLSSDVDVTMA
jgi:5-methylthioadenosine/S-adenosylhomocysteine deaminase